MRNIIHLILIFVLIFFINNSFAQNYKISGAGTPAVNGIYVQNGVHGSDNLPKYDQFGGIHHIYHDLSTSYGQKFWVIDDDFDDEGSPSVFYFWNQPNPVQTTMPVGSQWAQSGESGALPNPISVVLATTFADGSTFSPTSGTPGTNDNPIGMFKLTATSVEGVLQSVTIDFVGVRTNVTNVKLWSSIDATFNSGSDIMLSTKADGNTVTFDAFNSTIGIAGSYYFVTADLAANATGDITASIPSETSFSFEFTNAPVAFTNAPLSTAAVPLPVELSAFSANVDENIATLNWETATEVNNYGFEIERQKSEVRTQNSEWEKVAFVEGHGNSNSPKIYSYSDKSVNIAGKYLYRLKQIDIDGTFEYSSQVEIEIGVPKEFEVNQNYPNPFNPTTTISFSNPEKGNVSVQVFNMLGEVIEIIVDQELNPGKYNFEFDASKLSSGTYVYRIVSGKNIAVKKMILLK